MMPTCRYIVEQLKGEQLYKTVLLGLSQGPNLVSSCLHQLGGRIQRLAGGQYLEIQEVKPEDSGQYSCVVTNMAGSTSLFFTVLILCKYDKNIYTSKCYLLTIQGIYPAARVNIKFECF